MQFPRDFARAAELFRRLRRAAIREAQYALATMYKEGRGVPQDDKEATRLLALAALADHLDAQVEYAIALHNGTGIAKDEAAAAQLLRKAARRGAPIAQNRLARILATGRGLPADPKEAVKWHIVSKAAAPATPGSTTIWPSRAKRFARPPQKEAEPWLFIIANSRS